MTRRQAAALLIVNAMVSLLISLTVVLLFARYQAERLQQQGSGVAATPVAEAELTPATTSSTTPPEVAVVATYIVKAGDSLSGIAYGHNVSLEALMRANNIQDADYITAGQALIIPGGGDYTAPTATRQVRATVPAVLTPEAGTAPIAIESIAWGDGPARESVTIANRGAQGIALDGWTLSDEDGHTYTFPNLFLWRSGVVVVHTGFGSDSATDLYWGLTEGVWDRMGEKASLRDGKGELVAEFSVGEG